MYKIIYRESSNKSLGLILKKYCGVWAYSREGANSKVRAYLEAAEDISRVKFLLFEADLYA